jgi:tRNA-2-methylthio-N6-dimethylallyladenosine synthase
VVQERYERLVDLVSDIAWQQNRGFEGREVEVLVSTGEGRKDAATERLTGRARDNRLVHFTPGSASVRPGDLATVRVTYAAPHHLVSDAPVSSVRRTRAGDVWEARTARPTTAVSLGLPGVGLPSDSAAVAVPACAGA